MASLHVARLAAISSYLLPVAASRQVPHPNCRPSKLRHNLSESSKRTRRPVALRDLKKIQQRLRADTFQAIIKVEFAADALQRVPPRIDGFCRGSVGAVHDSSREPARDIRHA